MLSVLLEKRGHVVIDAADGLAGAELIEQGSPRTSRSSTSGSCAASTSARRIRGQPHLDDVVLVALTGYGAPGDIAAAREAGFEHHLCKPADLTEIEAILATLGVEAGLS